MQKEIHPGVIAVIVIVIVILIAFFAVRTFHSPASGGPLTPQQAGLGKPVLPAIPSAPKGGGR